MERKLDWQAPWMTEEHLMFKESTRKFMEAELAPHTERWRGDGQLAKVAKRLGKTESAAMSRLRRLMRAASHVPGNQ